ncbi:phage head morphogenesis protein [Helicobacter labacensis]|uniref:phage head morphogenesis protein n=1 Tax=Helicobacter labacensis TaxID=2316079 RepID=UPI000EAE89BC|nr:phage minor head protein [Helicobacter labacensis]
MRLGALSVHYGECISALSKIDTLVAYQSALSKALAKGQSYAQFLKANPNLLSDLDKKRKERIFNYNLIYANTKGKMLRYESAPPIEDSSDGDGWYYEFHSRHDDRARHLEFDKIILPRKHPFWQTHTPPLDWGCRCELQMWSERQLERKGLKVSSKEKIEKLNDGRYASSAHAGAKTRGFKPTPTRLTTWARGIRG